MKKIVSKKKPKDTQKRDFQIEYAEIMKGANPLPSPQWNKPGDSFTQFSMYTEYSSTTSSNSLL